MLKTLTYISSEELRHWAEDEWEKLKALINEAVKKLPDENQEVSYDDDKLIVTLLGGGVTVQPEVYEARRLGGIHQKPGWSIASWKHEAETHERSADYEISEEKIASHTIGAAVIAIKLSFDVLLEDWGSFQMAEQVSTVVPVE
jgi:hypothetical protein